MRAGRDVRERAPPRRVVDRERAADVDLNARAFTIDDATPCVVWNRRVRVERAVREVGRSTAGHEQDATSAVSPIADEGSAVDDDPAGRNIEHGAIRDP